jgi:hypothetical protein
LRRTDDTWDLAVSRISHLSPRSLTRPPAFAFDFVSCGFLDQLPASFGFQSPALLSISARLASGLNFQLLPSICDRLAPVTDLGAAFNFRAACAALPCPAAAIDLPPASTGYQSPSPASANLRLAPGNRFLLKPSTDFRPASILRIRLHFPANSRLAPGAESFPLCPHLRTTHCGSQITTLVIPESFGTHERQPVFYLTLL